MIVFKYKNKKLNLKERGLIMSIESGMSDSQELMYYIEKVMEDGKLRSVQQIKSRVKQETTKPYTDGVYAGVLRRLENDGKLMRPKRGMYQSFGTAVEGVSSKVICILEKTIEDIKKEAKSIDILEASDEEFEVIGLIKELKDFLEKIINKLES